MKRYKRIVSRACRNIRKLDRINVNVKKLLYRSRIRRNKDSIHHLKLIKKQLDNMIINT